MGAEGGLYGPLVLCIAAVLMACGLALGIQMIGAVIGPFRFLAPSAEEARRAFGLWTIHVDEASPESARRLRAWRAIAPPDRPVFESPSLAELVERGVRAVAVPGGRKLSGEDAAALRGFLLRGGGAVLTGSLGVTTPDGQWQGYDLMARLLDVPRIQQLAFEQSRTVAAFRRGPLSSRLAPAEPIALIAESGAPAISDAGAELRWSAGELSASRRLAVGDGRLAWLSVGPENARSGAGEPRNAMTRLVRASIDWASRVPSVEILGWPGGARFAARVLHGGESGNGDVLRSERAVREAVERAARTGALARLALPAPGDSGTRGDVLERIAREELARRAAWLPRDGEVRRWTETRALVDARVRRTGPQRLLVEISNRGREAAAGVALRVHLNRRASSAEVGVTKVGQVAPTVVLRAGAEHVDLQLPALPPRESLSYHLDLRFGAAAEG